ncbi:hypothetical protein HII36_34675 [Nonomuraea sp. NN258]|uniref:hypothetical protein n=1 Tax=Nonomuraea antri TaxID=2730852 RepID=UPI0015698F98|nr:hypothetical protein [Nonomuraea antri]NRQ36945.1 hypothetical protein [Nonomuraea antri]
MSMGVIERLDRGPITDGHFLTHADKVYAAARRGPPWNYPEPTMPTAIDRFRARLATSDIDICTAWSLPRGFAPLNDRTLGDGDAADLFHQPGAMIVALAYGYQVQSRSLDSVRLADLSLSTGEEVACMLSVCARPSERLLEDRVLRSLMFLRRERQGLIVIPPAGELPVCLRELGWQKVGRATDVPSDLPLNVYFGPILQSNG